MHNLGSYLSRNNKKLELLTTKEAANMLGISTRTLANYRFNGTLSMDIHWFRINSRVVRFNKILLEHWILNRSNEDIHWKYVEKFYAKLPN